MFIPLYIFVELFSFFPAKFSANGVMFCWVFFVCLCALVTVYMQPA